MIDSIFTVDIKGTGEETQGNRIQEDDLDLHMALIRIYCTLYHSQSPGKMISVEKNVCHD